MPRASGVPVPLERDVKRAVMDLYRKVGLTVWNLDQGYRPGGKRHGTTRQSKGLADLYVTGRGHTLWHEVKRPGGAQRKEQADFEAAVTAAGVPYALGGVAAAILALRNVWGMDVQLRDPDKGERLTMPGKQDHFPVSLADKSTPFVTRDNRPLKGGGT